MTISVGYLHGDHGDRVSHSFMYSLMRMMNENPEKLLSGDSIAVHAGPLDLVKGRNTLAQIFLDKTEDEFLLMLDTDMGFGADLAVRLWSAVSVLPVGGPVAVGALCYGLRQTESDGMGGYRVEKFPTIYELIQDNENQITGFSVVYEDIGAGSDAPMFAVPINKLIQVAATGTACLLISRPALIKVRAEYGDTWFNQIRYSNGEAVSEDLSFCYRLGTVGVPIYVDTGIKTTHHKPMWVQ